MFLRIISMETSFSIKISWNDLHGMFSTVIPWSIKLGPLKCRITSVTYRSLHYATCATCSYHIV